jgi:hypothetical protein
MKRRVLLAGDFHLHTIHSDGSDTPAEVIALCEKAGMDVIALVDHNNTEQNFDAPRSGKLVILSGMEYTNYRGHASFLFPDAHARFDQDPFSNTFEEMVGVFAKARAEGALICINHPMCDTCPWTFGWEGVPFDLVEVWNGPMKGSELKAIRWWHDLLVRGRRIAVIGGSDTHRPDPLRGCGGPTTFFRANSRARADILEGLRAGRSSISCSRNGPQPDLSIGDALVGDTATAAAELPGTVAVRRANAGDLVRVLDRTGTREWRVTRSGDFSARFHARHDAGFYRVEVWREPSPGMSVLAALTNPVYVA